MDDDVQLMASIEFKDQHGIVRMWAERDCAPFDNYIIGHFEKGDEGYYIFEPSNGVQMTCKHLRTAAAKASELNTGIQP